MPGQTLSTSAAAYHSTIKSALSSLSYSGWRLSDLISITSAGTRNTLLRLKPKTSPKSTGSEPATNPAILSSPYCSILVHPDSPLIFFSLTINFSHFDGAASKFICFQFCRAALSAIFTTTYHTYKLTSEFTYKRTVDLTDKLTA